MKERCYHAPCRGAATWHMGAVPACAAHLNRKSRELALAKLAEEAGRCTDHPGRTQRPRFRNGAEAFHVWCWGAEGGRLALVCKWRQDISPEQVEAQAKTWRAANATKI